MLLPMPFRQDGDVERQFADYLTRERFGCIIMQGRAQAVEEPRTLSHSEAAGVLERFAAADSAWISVRHRVPMVYHFACQLDQPAAGARLLEYLDIFAEERHQHFRHVLELLAMQGIASLEVPLQLDRRGYDGYLLEYPGPSRTILRKKD
ncbi:hypothetical protein D3C75_746850 [compost metagenome]